MTKDELYKLHEKNSAKEITFEGSCQDCNKYIVVTSIVREDDNGIGFDITGGAICKVDRSIVVKCDECFKLKPTFGSITEVYARVVGYLRPLQQWNKGKQEEWKVRTKYDGNKAIDTIEEDK